MMRWEWRCKWGAFAVIAGKIGRSGGADNTFIGGHGGARVIRGKAGQRTVDQLWRRRRIIPQPQPVHYAGPKIFKDHIGGRHQLFRGRGVFRIFQIEGDAALAPVPGRVGWCVHGRTLRALDANNIGTLVRQQHPQQWPGDILTKIDDANTLKNTGHGFPLPKF